ncbi:MAG: cation-transporting P-type ATPase [Desulfuromonadales bacterium]
MRESSPVWHALAAEEVLTRLDSRRTGLTNSEVARQQERFGPNRLPPPRRRTPLQRFLLQFHNVLIYVLLAAAGITALLGHLTDSAVIFGVVLINAVIGFLQEGKAEKALEAIRDLLSLQAITIRDGARQPIPAEDLVPGDIVFLQAGDKIPADLRLLQVRDLQADEAMLTGESLPTAKDPAPVAASATIGDRRCLAFSGTIVTAGQGTGVVVATGGRTEVGRISAMLAEVQILTTPLLRKINDFARTLTGVILVVAAATFAFGVLVRDYLPAEMFLAAVGLIVAAIPEGLPAVITITLAIGVQRMARRKAIIRRLPAVETLGAVTVVCTDKTGTLTRGEMTVQSILCAGERLEISGVGYDPHGGVTLDGREIDPAGHPLTEEIARAALLCNDASLRKEGGQWRVQGDPTDGALLILAAKTGLDLHRTWEQWPRDDVIPFEATHRFMATLHHDHAGNCLVYLKGAPERLLHMCARQRQDGEERPLDRDFWQGQVRLLAGEGKRVLAIATRRAACEKRQLNFADVENGLTLLGLVGIIDPPRPEAIEAVRQCRDAGIKVTMITGDHLLTAQAIGGQMGIGEDALSGEDVEGMSEEELRRRVRTVSIFARAAPEHKLRLVKALQDNGEITAMTGDGVNDAPALKRADVGVAMGIKGTEVAKESAEMVLMDDNFASIAHAVEEGRTVYDNIRKAIIFILPTSVAEALVILAAIAMGALLPITPVQILWVNMITAVTLALALAFEPAEENIMRRPPRPPQAAILSGFLVWRLVYVSLILLVGTFGLFLWARGQGAAIEPARTVAVNTLVFFEAFYLLNTRYLHAPVLNRRGLFGNRYILGAILLVVFFQILFTYLPPLQLLFGTAPIAAADWGRAVLVASSVFILVEAEKVLGAVVAKWTQKRG